VSKKILGRGKCDYLEACEVAIKIGQTAVNASQLKTFADDRRKRREVQCPNCKDAYCIGYPVILGPTAPFEELAAMLFETFYRLTIK
jgi:hypothetical protein